MNTVPVTESLPPYLVAGDVLAASIQTCQPSTSIFGISLTAVINNVPTRYVLGGVGAPIAIDSTGVAALQLPSSTTVAWLPGRYDWVAFAIDANSNRTTLAQGQTVIQPDPTSTTPSDPRSYNRKVLDQIRALRAGKVLDDVMIYKIGGRELTRCTHAELARLEAEYETRWLAERRRKGERLPTKNKGINFGGRW